MRMSLRNPFASFSLGILGLAFPFALATPVGADQPERPVATERLAKTETPAITDTLVVTEAPVVKFTGNASLKVEVLNHHWKESFVWEKIDRTETSWTARIMNHNPEPRHICLNVEFLDEDGLPVFQNGKCEVIPGSSEGDISGRIVIESPLLDEVKTALVVPLEAHQLHSFVPRK